MARKSPTRRRARRLAPAEPVRPLIDWDDAPPQLRVLDWRHRAGEWGLPVDGDAASGDPDAAPLTPAELAEDDEDSTDDAGPDGTDEDQSVEDADVEAAGASDTDLVRKYLQQVGRTPLLTAPQEAALGQRIDAARAAILSSIARIPGAV